MSCSLLLKKGHSRRGREEVSPVVSRRQADRVAAAQTKGPTRHVPTSLQVSRRHHGLLAHPAREQCLAAQACPHHGTKACESAHAGFTAACRTKHKANPWPIRPYLQQLRRKFAQLTGQHFNCYLGRRFVQVHKCPAAMGAATCGVARQPATMLLVSEWAKEQLCAAQGVLLRAREPFQDLTQHQASRDRRQERHGPGWLAALEPCGLRIATEPALLVPDFVIAHGAGGAGGFGIARIE